MEFARILLNMCNNSPVKNGTAFDHVCNPGTIALYNNFNIIEKTLITLYSIIFALGTIGNGLVIWIAAFRMKKTINATWFLNLAIADFLCCASLPLRIVLFYYYMAMYNFCKLNIILFLLNMSASVLLLTAMSIDHCVSVMWPFWAKVHRTRKLVRITAAIIWVLSALWTVFVFLYYKFSDLYFNEWCISLWRILKDFEYDAYRTIQLIRLFTMFVIPFLIILISYLIIFLKLKKSKRSQRSQRPYRIITAIILCFFICWCPYYIWHLTPMYYHRTIGAYTVDIIVTNLACLNSCINPIIYVLMSQDIKNGFFRSILSRLEGALKDQTNDLCREGEEVQHA